MADDPPEGHTQAIGSNVFGNRQIHDVAIDTVGQRRLHRDEVRGTLVGLPVLAVLWRAGPALQLACRVELLESEERDPGLGKLLEHLLADVSGESTVLDSGVSFIMAQRAL
ncbi:MAG TPA: hypothetical protein VEI28_01110 [Thermodesulfovibrionales bacterium]|nr:hypothetical protein [Thermodesulfovibrionales bacterium]